MDANHQNKTTGKEQQKTWWQNKKKSFIIAAVSIIVLFLIFALAIFWFGWNWTGFTSATGPTLKPMEQYRPAKTLWDMLQLLIVPIILAIAGYLLNQVQKGREERATKQRDKTEHDIASDNQREAALQAYIDSMSELLLHEKLRNSKPEDEVRNIARVRTLTLFRGLDAHRKANALLFLYESGLIDKDKPIVDLSGTSSGDYSFLSSLSGANLSEAYLVGAYLRGAYLSRVNLRSTFLIGADLTDTDLSGTYLLEANLTGANLTGTNLKDARGITIEELENQAESLQGTIMPNGTIHP